MSSYTSDEVCGACGTRLEVIYYQRRAADEPPDAVKYCTKCPIEANSLSIKSNFVDDYVPVTKRPMSISSVDSAGSTRRPDMPYLRRSSTGYVIIVEGGESMVRIKETGKVKELLLYFCCYLKTKVDSPTPVFPTRKRSEESSALMLILHSSSSST